MVELLLALCLNYPQWQCDPGFTRMINMPDTYDASIQAAAEKHLPGYDWRLYKALLWAESKFDPDAESHVGAKGLAQFMDPTWAAWSVKAGYAHASPFDPEAAIVVGAYYMRWQIQSWHWPRPDIDRLCLAMASYNAGLGNIIKAQRRAGNASMYAPIIAQLPAVTGHDNARQTTMYVRKILFYYDYLVAGNVQLAFIDYWKTFLAQNA